VIGVQLAAAVAGRNEQIAKGRAKRKGEAQSWMQLTVRSGGKQMKLFGMLYETTYLIINSN